MGMLYHRSKQEHEECVIVVGLSIVLGLFTIIRVGIIGKQKALNDVSMICACLYQTAFDSPNNL